MNARQVPSEAQPLLGRKTERRAFATTRSTLGVVAAAACGVVGLAALQRGGHAVPFLGAKRASPDAALRTQAETIRAAYYEGAAVSGDLQVRPFVRYGETGNLGSTGYEKCVGPDAKPSDGYHKTDAEAVRADLVFTPTTSRVCESGHSISGKSGSLGSCSSLDDITPEHVAFTGRYCTKLVPDSQSIHELSSTATKKEFVASVQSVDNWCKMVRFEVTRNGDTCNYNVVDAGYTTSPSGDHSTCTTTTQVLSNWASKNAQSLATNDDEPGYGIETLQYAKCEAVDTFWYKTPTSDVPGYNVNHVENDSCVGRNELEQLVGTATLAECAAACDADTRCVSFEVREEDAAKVTYGSLAKLARCNLSSTCDNAQARSEGNGGVDRPWYLFHKA